MAPDAAGTRLDRWLADASRLGSRRRAADALARGRVVLDGVEQTLEDAARRLRGGEDVRLWLDRPGSATRRGARRAGSLDMLYEDRDVLVLVKPAGLLTVPLAEQPGASSLADLVDDYWRSHGKRHARAVHRLDRDTSGPVVFARTPLAERALRDQFASRQPERVYHAIVYGRPSPEAGKWRQWLSWDSRTRRQRPVEAGTPRGYEAVASYRTVDVFRETTLIEVTLETGKRHQIRVQAWLAGHALVGERIYVGPPAAVPSHVVAFDRQALHGVRLAFAHPRTGERLAFDVPPPEDFARLLDRLRRS